MGIYSRNRTMLREGSYNEEAEAYTEGSMLECLIDARRTDMEIFETVIGNDFYHAYNEAGTIYLSEADEEKKDGEAKEGIIAKIKRLIKRIKDAIVGFFASFKKKAKDVVDKDKELYNKYGKLVKEKGAGKKIKTKYKEDLIKLSVVDEAEKYANIEEMGKAVKTISDSMDSVNINDWETTQKPKIEADIKAFEDKLTSLEKEIDDRKEEESEEKEITIDQSIVNNICGSINVGLQKSLDYVDNLSKMENSALDSMYKSADYTARFENDEKAIANMNTISGYITKLTTDIGKLNSIIQKDIQQLYSVHRGIFSALGELCSKDNKESSSEEKKPEENKTTEEKKEETKQESARVSAIYMLSDMYIEEAFSF